MKLDFMGNNIIIETGMKNTNNAKNSQNLHNSNEYKERG